MRRATWSGGQRRPRPVAEIDGGELSWRSHRYWSRQPPVAPATTLSRGSIEDVRSSLAADIGARPLGLDHHSVSASARRTAMCQRFDAVSVHLCTAASRSSDWLVFVDCRCAVTCVRFDLAHELGTHSRKMILKRLQFAVGNVGKEGSWRSTTDCLGSNDSTPSK
jgi:hypothetical protein